MDILPLITVLLSGAIGGVIGGQLMPRFSMGKLGNLIIGVIGGGLGGYLLDQFGMSGTGVPGSGAMDLMNIVTTTAGSSLSGGAFTIIIGYIKGTMAKKE